MDVRLCLSVCPVYALSFESINFIFGMQVHLRNIQIKFAYQVHQANVIGAKRSYENNYIHLVVVHLQLKDIFIIIVIFYNYYYKVQIYANHGRVANPRPVARIKTGRVAQPITDAADAKCNAPQMCCMNVTNAMSLYTSDSLCALHDCGMMFSTG